MDYEEALTREDSTTGLWYGCSGHFLWCGERTRQLDNAHVEYMRGIANPVGVKAGPSSDPAELVRVIRRLWPSPRDAPGKIVIITRLGAAGVLTALPRLITAVREAAFDSPVVWVCDPMHGNTKVTSSGYKTREFDDILTELKCVRQRWGALGGSRRSGAREARAPAHLFFRHLLTFLPPPCLPQVHLPDAPRNGLAAGRRAL